MGCKCIKVYCDIFILALSSLCNKEIRSEKSLRIHFKENPPLCHFVKRHAFKIIHYGQIVRFTVRLLCKDQGESKFLL